MAEMTFYSFKNAIHQVKYLNQGRPRGLKLRGANPSIKLFQDGIRRRVPGVDGDLVTRVDNSNWSSGEEDSGGESSEDTRVGPSAPLILRLFYFCLLENYSNFFFFVNI